MATSLQSLTLQQIQGRLNQKEIPWLASDASATGLGVKFSPKAENGVTVFWDRGHRSAASLEAIVDFLASNQR